MPEEQFASCYHRRTAAKTLENLLKLLLPKYSKNFATIHVQISADMFSGNIKTSVCKFERVKSFGR